MNWLVYPCSCWARGSGGSPKFFHIADFEYFIANFEYILPPPVSPGPVSTKTFIDSAILCFFITVHPDLIALIKGGPSDIIGLEYRG